MRAARGDHLAAALGGHAGAEAVAALAYQLARLIGPPALEFETLVHHHAVLQDFIARNAAAAVAGYVALYIAVVALSLPGGAVLTITGGVLFGVVIGGAAASVGATIGAICIFLIARSAVGEQLARRAGPLAERLAEEFRADAFSYLLFLRLVPLFPFWLVNLVPALCGVRLATFAAATAIGILPATFAFAFVGAGLDSVIAAQDAAYRACLAAARPDYRLDFQLRDGDHAAAPRRAGGARRAGAHSGGGQAVARARHPPLAELEHDPEKWIPVFGKDHAPSIARAR